MGLFEVKKTNIILNGDPTDLSIEEIFDAKKYQNFIGVTYSASPSFLNHYLKDFKKMKLVVGIPDEKHLERANTEIAQMTYKNQLLNVLADEPPSFFKNLSAGNRKNFQTADFEMFAPSIGYSIHSKFYLLWNDANTEQRLILGSANLSDQAFNNNIQQLEEILIFDNNPLFGVMQKRYEDDIEAVVMPYFPKELLKVKPKKMTPGSDVGEAIILSKTELAHLKQSQIIDKLEDIQGKINLGILPVSIVDDLKELPELQEITVQQQKEEIEQIETVYELSKEVISTRSKEPKFVTPTTLKKNVVKKLALRVTQVAVNAEIPERPLLVSSPSQRDYANAISGLFIQDGPDKTRLIPYGKKATPEQLLTGMKIIQHLLENYEKYTVNYEPEYGTRIYEALLYVFTAPFIYEIKNQAQSVEAKNDIPQFLFLGGISGSGKSSLLRILSKMTNLAPDFLAFVDYDDVIPKNEHQRKLKTIQQLTAWMQEENVSPLLIDEIPNDFFTKSNYGEELIVTTTNFRGRSGDPSPVLIGTTNTDNYSMEERAARRSYYLRIDKPFDEDMRQQTNQAYIDLLKSITTDLYQDFILRFAEKFSDETTKWNNYQEKGKVDFLFYAREIFKEYYHEIGQPLPIYFPTHRFDDTKESNQEKWRKLYLGSSHDEFHFNKEDNRLIFRMTGLDQNLSLRYGDTKPSVIYSKAMPDKLVVGSKDAIDIELYADQFLEWIGVENKASKEKEGLFGRLFGKKK